MRPLARLLALAALAALAGCEGQRRFDSAAWKADSLTDQHQVLKVRRAMAADVRRRYPAGTQKSVILRDLGAPAEEVAPCDYPGADSCVDYDLGASLADYDYLIFAFKGDRLDAIHSYRS